MTTVDVGHWKWELWPLGSITASLIEFEVISCLSMAATFYPVSYVIRSWMVEECVNADGDLHKSGQR